MEIVEERGRPSSLHPHDIPPNMPPHVLASYYPSHPGNRSRASSAASRYTPEEYQQPMMRPSTPNSNGYNPTHLQEVSRYDSGPHAFTPAQPDQYRAPPDTRGVPPAQLYPYQAPIANPASDGYDQGRPHMPYRPSTDSRRSGRSGRRSHHSERSHHSHGHERGRSSHDHHQHHEHESQHRSRNRHGGADDVDEAKEDLKLRRRNTFRSG